MAAMMAALRERLLSNLEKKKNGGDDGDVRKEESHNKGETERIWRKMKYRGTKQTHRGT